MEYSIEEENEDDKETKFADVGEFKLLLDILNAMQLRGSCLTFMYT